MLDEGQTGTEKGPEDGATVESTQKQVGDAGTSKGEFLYFQALGLKQSKTLNSPMRSMLTAAVLQGLEVI